MSHRTRHNSRWTRRVALVGVAVSLAMFGAACSDDESTSTGTTNTTAATADPAAFCDAYAKVAPAIAGEPDDPASLESALDDLESNAPSAIADQVQTLVTSIKQASGSTDTTASDGGSTNGTATDDTSAEGGDEEGGPPPEELLTSSAAVGVYAAENCADETLQVEARDYEFVGLPSTLAAGTYGIVMDNQGTEWHEMILVKKNEGVTQTAQELLQLPEEQVMEMITTVGGAFAAPGEKTGLVADLTEGDYVAVCFIPVGTTSLESTSEGPPHAMQGMVAEFSVT